MPRGPVTLNRSAVLALRRRLGTVTRGREILEEKLGILQRELPAARDREQVDRRELQAALQGAREALSKAAVLSGGDEVARVVRSQRERAAVEVGWESVMGIPVPRLGEVTVPRPPDFGPPGTSVLLDQAIERFRRVLSAAARAATSAERHRRLSEDLDRTARRVASLDHILAPRLRSQIDAATSALEEAERDEVARTRWATSGHSLRG